jgi:serine/threonine protein kinase
MAATSVHCPTCGAINQAQATSCRECGQSIRNKDFHAGATAEDEQPLQTKTPITGQLEQNHLLKQRYRIISRIGKGGFSAVYKASDNQFDGRVVAIKEISQGNLAAQELAEATEAFTHDVHRLAGLVHPNLPRMYDQFTEARCWYIVMDFIDGKSLEEHLHDARDGHLLLEQVLQIGIQLCTVLDYLHTRQPPIIFRDLKPANIMLTPANDLYLIDFSIAHHFRRGQARTDVAFGTPGYAAPEQYGSTPPTPGSDIYSLGATLHQLLSGNDPSETPFCFAPLQSCPADLETLIMQIVDMDESKRPANLTASKQALQRIVSGEQREIAPPGVLQALQSPTVHRPPISPWQIPSAPGAAARQIALQRRPVPGKRGKTKRVHEIVVGNRGFSLSRRKLVIGLVGLVVVGGGTTWIHNILSQKSSTLYTYRGHSNWVYSVAWSPNGKRIASASYDGTVQVWDALTGGHVFTYQGHTSAVNAAVWSPDDKRIASASSDGSVQVWMAATGERLLTYRGHTGPLEAVAWSPDGTRIASAGEDATVQVWMATTGRPLRTYRGHSGPIKAVAWSPDGTQLASAGEVETVLQWDATTGDSIHTYTGHTGRVNAVAWSPDGKYIASASLDQTVQVWDALTGSHVITYRGHTSGVNAVAWSPNGKRIASASYDGTVQVWDALTGSNVYTNMSPNTEFSSLPVNAVAWSPDGKLIASGGGDETVQVWQPG